MVSVTDDERERSAKSPAVSEPREHLDPIALDLLAGTAAVSLLAAVKVGVNRLPIEHEPGGKPRHDRDQRGPVRLAGSGQLERHASNPSARRITSTGAASPVQSSNEAAPWATSTSSPSRTWAPLVRAAAAVAEPG